MKAITIVKPFEIEIRDLPVPEPKPGEALLQVLYCGICGADVASFTGNQPFTTYPRVPGHEFSARIVSIPENDRNLKPGDHMCFVMNLFPLRPGIRRNGRCRRPTAVPGP